VLVAVFIAVFTAPPHVRRAVRRPVEANGS